MNSSQKVKLCIDYVSTEAVTALDCYFLDEKSDKIRATRRIPIEGAKFEEVSPNEIRKLAETIMDYTAAESLKAVGKVNFLISSRIVFSFSDLFPHISERKIVKYGKRDLSQTFPGYEKKNAYIETRHDDGNLGTCVFTTFCPLTILEKFEFLAKELKLTLGDVSTSNFSLTDRYEKFYSNDLPFGVLIDLESDYTLINLFINNTVVDDLFVEIGADLIKNSEAAEEYKSLIKSKVLAIVAKHEFMLEKYSPNVIKICSDDAIAAQRLHDYLTETTKFEVGFTLARPLATSRFPTKYVFNKYKSGLFKGFTLTETVVSLAIFAIMSAVCIGCIVPLTGLVKQSRRNSAVSLIVSDLGETFRSVDSDKFIVYYYEANDVTAPTTVEAVTRFYYDAEYRLTADSTDSAYVLTFKIDPDYPLLTIESFSTVAGKNLIDTVEIRG